MKKLHFIILCIAFLCHDASSAAVRRSVNERFLDELDDEQTEVMRIPPENENVDGEDSSKSITFITTSKPFPSTTELPTSDNEKNATKGKFLAKTRVLKTDEHEINVGGNFKQDGDKYSQSDHSEYIDYSHNLTKTKVVIDSETSNGISKTKFDAESHPLNSTDHEMNMYANITHEANKYNGSKTDHSEHIDYRHKPSNTSVVLDSKTLNGTTKIELDAKSSLLNTEKHEINVGSNMKHEIDQNGESKTNFSKHIDYKHKPTDTRLALDTKSEAGITEIEFDAKTRPLNTENHEINVGGNVKHVMNISGESKTNFSEHIDYKHKPTDTRLALDTRSADGNTEIELDAKSHPLNTDNHEINVSGNIKHVMNVSGESKTDFSNHIDYKHKPTNTTLALDSKILDGNKEIAFKAGSQPLNNEKHELNVGGNVTHEITKNGTSKTKHSEYIDYTYKPTKTKLLAEVNTVDNKTNGKIGVEQSFKTDKGLAVDMGGAVLMSPDGVGGEANLKMTKDKISGRASASILPDGTKKGAFGLDYKQGNHELSIDGGGSIGPDKKKEFFISLLYTWHLGKDIPKTDQKFKEEFMQTEQFKKQYDQMQFVTSQGDYPWKPPKRDDLEDIIVLVQRKDVKAFELSQISKQPNFESMVNPIGNLLKRYEEKTGIRTTYNSMFELNSPIVYKHDFSNSPLSSTNFDDIRKSNLEMESKYTNQFITKFRSEVGPDFVKNRYSNPLFPLGDSQGTDTKPSDSSDKQLPSVVDSNLDLNKKLSLNIEQKIEAAPSNTQTFNSNTSPPKTPEAIPNEKSSDLIPAPASSLSLTKSSSPLLNLGLPSITLQKQLDSIGTSSLGSNIGLSRYTSPLKNIEIIPPTSSLGLLSSDKSILKLSNMDSSSSGSSLFSGKSFSIPSIVPPTTSLGLSPLGSSNSGPSSLTSSLSGSSLSSSKSFSIPLIVPPTTSLGLSSLGSSNSGSSSLSSSLSGGSLSSSKSFSIPSIVPPTTSLGLSPLGSSFSRPSSLSSSSSGSSLSSSRSFSLPSIIPPTTSLGLSSSGSFNSRPSSLSSSSSGSSLSSSRSFSLPSIVPPTTSLGLSSSGSFSSRPSSRTSSSSGSRLSSSRSFSLPSIVPPTSSLGLSSYSRPSSFSGGRSSGSSFGGGRTSGTSFGGGRSSGSSFSYGRSPASSFGYGRSMGSNFGSGRPSFGYGSGGFGGMGRYGGLGGMGGYGGFGGGRFGGLG